MKVSLNWLKDYLDINLDPQKIGEILTEIGLEVEGEEQVESIPGGLAGVLVGEVLTCGPHPNADKLSLTTVNVGADEALQIVCGAPNVAQGQKVLVATVGTVLYPLGSEEPLKIKKGKIRGEVSAGMICAEDELSIGEDHDGILVLPADTPIGMAGKDYLKLETDYIYDIGLTPNRSDATNHIGVAKDLAAALQINYDLAKGVQMPDVSGFAIDNQNHPVEVVVENVAACPRYAGLTITDLKIKPSPEWLKNRLEAIGVRSINNVVDITNFVLHELGQPLHAFDLKQVKGQKIIVKTLAAGTTFLSLDDVERKLNAEDLMICDGESNGMCIGGVFGGQNSGVTDETTAIFLESAHFDSQYIRRTSMRHNLRTDAAKVFEKGSDPNVAVYALKRAAMLIQELAEGKISSELFDFYPNEIKPKAIEVKFQYVNDLIGVNLSKAEIKAILAALEMEVLEENETTFTVAVPTNKSDVLRPADIVEEVLRIYGLNKVPVPGSIHTAITISPNPDPVVMRNKIANDLSANGFNEMMAVSLSQSKYYQDILPIYEATDLVYINNTSNVHLDIMRPEMLMSGLEAIVHNQNRQSQDLKLFELGKSYVQLEDGIQETEHLSLFVTGKRNPESWIPTGEEPSSFYTIKAYAGNVLARLGFSSYQESSIKDDPFAYGLEWHRGPQSLVKMGLVQPKVAKAMGIKNEVFYAVFDWTLIMKALRKHKVQYSEISKFPSVRRDLALIIDNSVKFADITKIAQKTGKKLIKEINLFDVYENANQLGEGKTSYAVSFVFEDANKTLRDKEVDKVMNQLIQTYENQLGALIRR
jgi:phenylalanyl-tRNA synthetase beta chain